MNVGDKVLIKVDEQKVEAVLTNLNYKGKYVLFRTFLLDKKKRNISLPIKYGQWMQDVLLLQENAYIVKPRPDIGPCAYEVIYK